MLNKSQLFLTRARFLLILLITTTKFSRCKYNNQYSLSNKFKSSQLLLQHLFKSKYKKCPARSTNH